MLINPHQNLSVQFCLEIKSLFKSEALCLVGGTQEGKIGDKILQIP